MSSSAKFVSMILLQLLGRAAVSASEWSLDVEAIQLAITSKTKMLVSILRHGLRLVPICQIIDTP